MTILASLKHSFSCTHSHLPLMYKCTRAHTHTWRTGPLNRQKGTHFNTLILRSQRQWSASYASEMVTTCWEWRVLPTLLCFPKSPRDMTNPESILQGVYCCRRHTLWKQHLHFVNKHDGWRKLLTTWNPPPPAPLHHQGPMYWRASTCSSIHTDCSTIWVRVSFFLFVLNKFY